MANKTYVVKKANYDGYNQHFNEIGDWDRVKLWAKDGSLEKGDIVFELVKSRQPKIQTA